MFACELYFVISLQMEVVTVLRKRHSVHYGEMAVITPYSAQKSLICELKAEKQAKATGSATSGARRDPADTKLEELTIVSITESQGEVSYTSHEPQSSVWRYKGYVFPHPLLQVMNMDM